MKAQVICIGNKFASKARDEEFAALAERKQLLEDIYADARLALLREGNKLLDKGTIAMKEFGLFSPQSNACHEAEKEHQEKERTARKDFEEAMAHLEILKTETQIRWGII